MIEDKIDLSVTIGRSKFKNPVMPSSGIFRYGEEFASFLNLNDLGAIVVSRISLNPKLGNPPSRCEEVAGGSFLTTTGQQNEGVDRFVKDKLPFLRQFTTPVIVNVAGSSIEEYVSITERLNLAGGVAGIEINMACPNIQQGGLDFCASPEMAFKIVNSVRNATDLTIIAKLQPTVTDVTVLAQACEEAGADAVCSTFGPRGMAIDVNTRKSKLGKNLTAALGGPALKPVALRMAWQAARTVKIPVIGVGGITNAEDALEFLIAGATAVQIGAYNLVDPTVMIKTIEGIKKYMIVNGISSINEIIGTMLLD